jgi:SAM-dependent methyltransferase
MPEAKPRDQVESEVYHSVTRPSPRRNPLLRLLTDHSFAGRVIRYALRLPTPLMTEDRRVLEQIIFKYYASRAEIKSILFVGCEWYTTHYRRVFFPHHDYWTIEPSARARRYGARQHIVAPLERVDEFFPEDYFDLIICNGVYGFGLDTLEQCEPAFAHCYTRLRGGGQMVLGWTNVPARTPVPLESVESLQRFRKFVFPELGSWRYVTDTSYAHTYDFYCKEPRGPATLAM